MAVIGFCFGAESNGKCNPNVGKRSRASSRRRWSTRKRIRAAVIEDSCAGDESLRREVESLLAHHKNARDFIETPAFESSETDKSEVRDQAPVALQPGMRLGEYEIVKLIGSGGMGEVYRARDTRLGRDVAIKVLPSYVSTDTERLRRFEQEAKAAAALNHPNILAVHQLGTYRGAPYLISELLEGSTLREQLMRGPLPIRKAIDYGVQVTRGLAAAHEKGIAHRDLKPENLFVTNDGRVKILDFGLAKLVAARTAAQDTTLTAPTATEPGVILGTLGYMSPEQVRGATVDARSDVFSFGAVLFEMLSGQRAFKGQTSADTLSAILKDEPPDLAATGRDVPPLLDRIVHHCLEKDPTARFQSARDIAFALDSLSTISASVSASVPVNPTKLPKHLLGRAMMALVGTLILIAGLLIGRISAPPSAPPRYHRLSFARELISSAHFAPDQRTVVYSAARAGENELFSVTPHSVAPVSLGIKDTDIEFISPDRRNAVASALASAVRRCRNRHPLACTPQRLCSSTCPERRTGCRLGPRKSDRRLALR
jgi:serine/threonine protein kinase